MLSRRGFAGAVAAAAVVGAVGGRAGAAETAPAGAARCSVMLWAVAQAVPGFEDRLELVARAGYRSVELVREFAGWDEATWTAMLERMHRLGLGVDAVAPLKLGFADPAGGTAMLAELQAALPALRRFGRPQVILVSGPQVGEPARQEAVAVETLGKVAAVLRDEGMVAVIEPIDRLENPPVYLDGVTAAFAMVQAVNRPEVRVLYDFFHEQRTHGNLIEKLDGHVGEIGLVHVADVPGRHQPGTGEVHYGNIYAALRRLGYGGRVAMEFYPEGEPEATLRAARVEAERALAG